MMGVKTYAFAKAKVPTPTTPAIPAPTYFGQGGVAANTSTTTVTPALPASMLANDIIVIQALCLNSNTAFTTPTGYTLIADFNVGAHRVAWWWKRHTGTETAQAVVNTGRTSTNLLAGQVTARRGCITTGTPFEGMTTSLSATATAITGVNVTTIGANRLAENSFIELGANVAATTALPWLETLDQGTTGGGGGRFYVADSPIAIPSTINSAVLTGPNAAYGVVGLAWKAS